MIKLYVDEFTVLPIEEEYINDDGIREYSVFMDVIISLRNKDIKIPKNTITTSTNVETIILDYLLTQRTITPLEVSIIYYQVMKKMRVPFLKRLGKWFISLKNLW